MNRSSLTAALSIILVGGALAATGTALAGKKHADGDAAQLEKKAEMEMGAPVELRQLSFLEGSWDISETIIHEEEEVDQAASATVTFILNGAAIQSNYKGMHKDHPVEELTITTYNRHEQTFEMVAVNDLWPRLALFSQGSFEDGKLVLTATKVKEDKEVRMRRTVERTGPGALSIVNEFDKGDGWIVWATESWRRR